MKSSSGLSNVIGWLVLAVGTAIVVVIFAFLLQSSTCVDEAPGHGESVCTIGPAFGVGGTWGISIVGAAVIIFAIVRAIHAARRRNQAGQ
jgi:low affinity Fe/Cu permease